MAAQRHKNASADAHVARPAMMGANQSQARRKDKPGPRCRLRIGTDRNGASAIIFLPFNAADPSTTALDMG